MFEFQTRRSLLLSLGLGAAGLAASPLSISAQSPGGPPPPPQFPRPETDPAALKARLEARLTRLAAEDNFQGVFGLDLDTRPLVRSGFGVADPASNRPFTAATQIEMASIGKTYTAAAILKLRDLGKLALTDKIGRFYPDVPADKAAVTIFHLLTGSSGLPSHPPVGGGLTRAEMEATVLATPLQAAPGERFIYSNLAFNLLAAIVEHVSGQTYDAFLYDQVLKPAGTRHTGYASAYDPAIAATDRQGRPLPLAAWGGAAPDWSIIGAGGLVSTVDDMLAWHHAFMAGRIVSPASVTAATTGWIDQGPNAPPGKYGLGRGIMAHDVYGKVIWHNGGDPAFTSYFAAMPDHGLAFFVSSNGGDATLLAAKSMRAMFGLPDVAMRPMIRRPG